VRVPLAERGRPAGRQRAPAHPVCAAEHVGKVCTGHGPADNLAGLGTLAALLLTALERLTLPDAIRWVSYGLSPT